jgi:flagellar motor switch protein FliM
MAEVRGETLRRKIAVLRGEGAKAQGPETALRAFRLAFARAARDEVGLDVEVTRVTDQRRSLAELLELPPDRAFLAMLEGPEGGLGLMALSPALLAALIEVQTVGRVTGRAPPLRRPTRTDAAMVAGTVDRTLRDLETALAEAPDLTWAGGFRYASFLDDVRPLGLLLEDQPYRVLTADLRIDGAQVGGAIVMALPAAGKGPKPQAGSAPAQDAAAEARLWSQALAATVSTAEVQLDAVMTRIRLPLAQVMALAPGALIPIGSASVDSVAIEATGGRRIAEARLGQNRGLRALRLTRTDDGAGARSAAPDLPRLAVQESFGAPPVPGQAARSA